MLVLGFIGLVMFGYFCGLLGNMLGIKDAVVLRRLPRGYELFVHLHLRRALSFWSPQLVTVVLSFVMSCVLVGSDYALLCNGAICFAVGVMTMICHKKNR